MATARSLSMIFVVAVLVPSVCFADAADGYVLGSIGGLMTVLKSVPSTEGLTWFHLKPGTPVNVLCRTKGEAVFGNPWWLKAVTVYPAGIQGWVAHYYVLFQSTVDNVCNVSLC